MLKFQFYCPIVPRNLWNEQIKKKDREVDDLNQTKNRMTWLLKQVIIVRNKHKKLGAIKKEELPNAKTSGISSSGTGDGQKKK